MSFSVQLMSEFFQAISKLSDIFFHEYHEFPYLQIISKMQSDDLQMAFNQMRDDVSVQLINEFFDFSSDPCEKEKEEPATKSGTYMELRGGEIQWESILDLPGKAIEVPKIEQNVEAIAKELPTSGLFEIRQSREKRFIDVSDFKRKEYIKMVKGTKEETSQLNINLKTLTKALLREETPFIKSTDYEVRMMEQFQGANANFKAFRDLFGVQEEEILENTEQVMDNKGKKAKDVLKRRIIIRKKADRLRKICLKNFSSRKIIWEINRGRMNPFNKITLLKFIEQIRMSCLSPENFTNWKFKIGSGKK